MTSTPPRSHSVPDVGAGRAGAARCPLGASTRRSPLTWLAIALVAIACAPDQAVPASAMPSTAPAPSTTPPPSPTSAPSAEFPTAVFAGLREYPVAEESAADLHKVLSDVAGAAGITATLMTPEGSWSGAAGTADGVRAMSPATQLAIGSITKSLVAAQVMQLVETGQLRLDEPAAGRLPPSLEFDTNGATIGHLLGMRSGIPDYVDALWTSLSADKLRAWTADEVLALVGPHRSPPGEMHRYSSSDYVLLGLILEQVRGRPLAEVLRDGVLSADGYDRLIYQPDERPTQPIALPSGAAPDTFGWRVHPVSGRHHCGRSRGSHGLGLSDAGTMVEPIVRWPGRLGCVAAGDDELRRRRRLRAGALRSDGDPRLTSRCQRWHPGRIFRIRRLPPRARLRSRRPVEWSFIRHGHRGRRCARGVRHFSMSAVWPAENWFTAAPARCRRGTSAVVL